jgi:hypothetical protein
LKQPQQRTYTIEEMSMMMNAFQGLQAKPKSGKHKFPSQDENKASQACKMLHSMSIREPRATIDDPSIDEL